LLHWADKAFCVNPDLIAQVPTAEFLPYVALPTRFPEVLPKPRRAVPWIVHAPSNRSIKGTQFLLAASETLRATHPHELQLLDGVPRDQALETYAQADIVVDQLRLGWYGAVAVEAMARGVPVVAYLNEDDLARIPRRMREELPIVNASPENLSSALARVLDHAELREELGRRGREFVRRWHHPLKIAKRLLQLYDNPSQSFWAEYDPDST
jgi:glycosyltransferase involved in cell wall biosynthesis